MEFDSQAGCCQLRRPNQGSSQGQSDSHVIWAKLHQLPSNKSAALAGLSAAACPVAK